MCREVVQPERVAGRPAAGATRALRIRPCGRVAKGSLKQWQRLSRYIPSPRGHRTLHKLPLRQTTRPFSPEGEKDRMRGRVKQRPGTALTPSLSHYRGRGGLFRGSLTE